MNLLCFDVAGPVGSIAVYKENACCHFTETPDKRSHAAQLVPRIEAGLKASSLTYQDLNYVTTTTGPGSFTGIRIGLATAKGIQIAAQLPVLGVSSFQLGYWKSPTSQTNPLPTLVVLEAFREDVYWQLFYPDGTSEKPGNSSPEEILRDLGKQEIYITGSGLTQVLSIVGALPSNYHILDHPSTAKDLGTYCLSLSPNDREALASKPAQPFYLRPPDIGGPR